jgi:AraC-like DNA-binding protein
MFVKILMSELRQRNWSDEAWLEGSSVDAEMLSDISLTISSEEWSRLLLRALQLTRDPALGLALGASISPSMLQVVGWLLGACSTLRDAIGAVDRYNSLLSTNTTWELEEEGDTARLYCSDGIEHPVARRTSFDATLALGYTIGRNLVAVGSDEVWFEHPEPPYAQHYARVFACPVRFGQPRSALVFARRLLDQPQPHGDDTLREVLRARADTLLCERVSTSLTERVRALLRYEMNNAHLNVEYVAGRMNMKARSLRRRLTSERTSLSDLITEARMRIAKRELAKPGASVKGVAHELGYSEASAFHRAFKRWTGWTPALYMKEAQAGAGSRLHDASAPE